MDKGIKRYGFKIVRNTYHNKNNVSNRCHKINLTHISQLHINLLKNIKVAGSTYLISTSILSNADQDSYLSRADSLCLLSYGL